MPNRRGLIGLIAVAAVIALLLVRCGSAGDDDVETVDDVDAVPTGSYVEGAGPAAAMAAFQSELGDRLKVREAAFYPDYVIIEAQDPAKPQNIDRYMLRDGDIGDPEPVHLSSSDIVEVQVFRVDSVEWDAVADVAAAAPDRLRIEDGEASYAFVEKDYERELRITLYVTSARRSGYVVADIEGRILDATLS